jgi:uncharacterized protein (TIRG00374 family)
VSRLVARIAGAVVLALLIGFVLVPQYADAQRALQSVGMVSPFLLLLGLTLELGSLASLGALTRAALDPATRPAYPTILRIDLTGVAVTNSVPGGGATALAVRYRLLTRAGTPSVAVAGGIAVETTVYGLLLGVVFAAGLLLSLGSWPSSPYYHLAGGFILLVFGGAAFALMLAVRHPVTAVALTRSATRRLSEAHRDRVAAFVESLVAAVAGFVADRRRFGVAIACGLASWLLDAAALWVLLTAFGFHAAPGHLLLAYGLAAILALVPITPGGLGVVEGVLVPTLVALGSPYGAAVLGVTAWRLVQFWMPIPLGGLAAVSLLVGSRTRRAEARAERVRMGEG